MKKILITGASSFLGWNLCQSATADHEIIGLVNEHSSNQANIQEYQANLTDFGSVDSLFEAEQPDMIIHTAAYSKPDLCQNDPVWSHKVNVEATLHLAHHAKNLDIPFVFTSTDLVFDGLEGNYNETSLPNPISVYGEHKLLAEQLILEVHPGALICRCPLMYGFSGTENQSYITELISKMQQGIPVHLFTDEIRSQAYGKDVADGILLLSESNCNGIYHLGGPEQISRFDFGNLVKDVFELPESEIIASLQHTVNSIPPRPPDVSLDISKATKKGYHPKYPLEGLKDLKRSMKKTIKKNYSAGNST